MTENEIEANPTLESYTEEMSLTERADKIMLQPSQTDDDINELHKIKREMSKLYSKANRNAVTGERNYNIVKYDLEKHEGGVTAQENKAKLAAENLRGSFKEYRGLAQAIKDKKDEIKSFCIHWYVVQKGMRDASMTQDDY